MSSCHCTLTWSAKRLISTRRAERTTAPERRAPRLERRSSVPVANDPPNDRCAQGSVRAAQYGFPLVLAIIGGDPGRFAGFVDLYHRALAHLGHAELPLAVHSRTVPCTSGRPRRSLTRSLGRCDS